MSTRVEELAAQFEAANSAVIALVESCPEEQWRQPCANEERTVAAVAHHVAEVNGAFAGIVAKLAAGQTYTPASSMQDVHQGNAQEAREHAAVTKAAVLEALRANGAAVARQLRSLGDAQLADTAGTFGERQLSVAQVVEWVVIGHTAEHLASLRATVGGAGQPR